VDTYAVVAVLVAFFLGGCVKGIVGLGLPTVALALLTSVLGLREAVPLIVVPIILTNFWQAVQGGRLGDLLRRFWPMNLGALIGVPIGTWVLFDADPAKLAGALGIILSLYAVSGLASVRFSISRARERVLSAPMGLVMGLLMGMTGSSAVPLIPYLHSLEMDRDTFVQALGLAFFVISVALGIALAGNGAYDTGNVTLSAASLVPAFAGMILGRRLRRLLDHERFQFLFFITLLVLGVNLIRKGFL